MVSFAFRLAPHASRLTMKDLSYVDPPKPWRRQALPVLRSPSRRDVGGCSLRSALCFFADTENGHGHVFDVKELKGEGG
jgi:hypothetical protein